MKLRWWILLCVVFYIVITIVANVVRARGSIGLGLPVLDSGEKEDIIIFPSGSVPYKRVAFKDGLDCIITEGGITCNWDHYNKLRDYAEAQKEWIQ